MATDNRCMKRLQIALSDQERLELTQLVHTGSSPARTQTRARILLLSDRSQGERIAYGEVAKSAMTTMQTAIRVRKRFLEGGLAAALYDKPKSGCPPKITGDIEAKLVMLACSKPPEGHDGWTLRLLADQMVVLGYIDSLSNVAVYKRLKKTNLSLGW